MCEFISINGEQRKIVLLDIKGGSAVLRTRHKNRKTKKDGFNILKKDIEKEILYILNLNIFEDLKKYTIYFINIPKLELKEVRTDLAGYDESIINKYRDNMKVLMEGVDNLNIILSNFAWLSGTCDIIAKEIVVSESSNKVMFYPLVLPKRDSVTGEIYYFEDGGDFREVLEMVLRQKKFFEHRGSDKLKDVYLNMH